MAVFWVFLMVILNVLLQVLTTFSGKLVAGGVLKGLLFLSSKMGGDNALQKDDLLNLIPKVAW